MDNSLDKINQHLSQLTKLVQEMWERSPAVKGQQMDAFQVPPWARAIEGHVGVLRDAIEKLHASCYEQCSTCGHKHA